MSAEDQWTRRLFALSEAFDSAFAIPAADFSTVAPVRVLGLRVAGVAYVVRLDECAGLLRLPAIHRLPSTVPAFRGVVVVEGALLAVYDLAQVLRLSPAPVERGWLLVTGGDDRLGLVVEALDGLAEMGTAQPSDEAPRAVVEVNGRDRRLLDVPSVVDELRQQIAPVFPEE